MKEKLKTLLMLGPMALLLYMLLFQSGFVFHQFVDMLLAVRVK